MEGDHAVHICIFSRIVEDHIELAGPSGLSEQIEILELFITVLHAVPSAEESSKVALFAGRNAESSGELPRLLLPVHLYRFSGQFPDKLDFVSVIFELLAILLA